MPTPVAFATPLVGRLAAMQPQSSTIYTFNPFVPGEFDAWAMRQARRTARPMSYDVAAPRGVQYFLVFEEFKGALATGGKVMGSVGGAPLRLVNGMGTFSLHLRDGILPE